jgi:hypothetical protein
MLRVVLPESAPKVAVIVEVPPVTAVARPVAFIVATAGVPEFQLTEREVRICDEPSE